MPGLKWLGRYLNHPYLWKLNKEAVARAGFIGIFVALLPIPLQMLTVSALAVILRANLPIAVSLTWLSNPLSFGPITYLEYKTGQWILNSRELNINQLSLGELMNYWHNIWHDLLIGSISLGLAAACIAWLSIHLFWQCISQYLAKRSG